MKFEKFLKVTTIVQFLHVNLAKKWKVEKEDLGWETALIVHSTNLEDMVKYIESLKKLGFKFLKKIGDGTVMSSIHGGQILLQKKKDVINIFIRQNIVSEWKVIQGYSGRGVF